jgi:antitoxin VapB
LNIKDAEADRLARALAKRTGETITQAVVTALRERWQRESATPGLKDEIMAIKFDAIKQGWGLAPATGAAKNM